MFAESEHIRLREAPFLLTIDGSLPLSASASASLGNEKSQGVLRIAVKHEGTGETWKAEFTPQQIEEITKKTGNYKRFSVFVEMLATALKKASKVLGLDLLTHEDLTAMKLGEKSLKQSIDFSRFQKFYLILTYAVAFDRVHYPMPLTKVDDHLSALEDKEDHIALLELELTNLKEERKMHMEEMSKLMREYDKLKHEKKQEAQHTRRVGVTREEELLQNVRGVFRVVRVIEPGE
ncbi:Coiled-coil domain-containing protein 61, partial [Chytridiales sp. JEL 0842]